MEEYIKFLKSRKSLSGITAIVAWIGTGFFFYDHILYGINLVVPFTAGFATFHYLWLCKKIKKIEGYGRK